VEKDAILNVVIWLPLVAAIIGALLPGALAGRAVLLGSVATLGVAIGMVVGFERGTDTLQYATDEVWISQLGIHYKIGVDGLNLALIVLTALLWTVALVWANLREWERPKLFYFHFALAQTAVFGAFCAQDLALFVVFFDLMLVPFYFLIGGWGGRDRVRATMKVVIYTLVGSLLMLAGAVATGVLASSQNDTELTFVLSSLERLPLAEGTQDWLFVLFAIAFLVKMPAFPLHGWLPDGYRAMPLPVVAVFSAVLSKVAAYGFLRIVLPVFPDASVQFQEIMLFIGLASILYGSVMAFTQTDLRLIAGFSSIAQLGFIVLGIFALRSDGAQGALLQMVNHGIVTAALFLTVGVLAARAGGSEDIRDMGGVAFRAPILAVMFLIIAFANLAMPGSANFIGEFLILLGVFKAKIVISIVAFTGVVLASVYMLRAFIRTMHNRVGPKVESREIALGDALAIGPLVLVILALAVYPQFLLSRSEESTEANIRAAQEIASPPEDQAQNPGFEILPPGPPETEVPQQP
jgi:NADH-quinone oxidoreductase subunit M